MTFIIAEVLFLWALVVQHGGAADQWWHLLAFAGALLLVDIAVNVSRIAKAARKNGVSR